MKKIYFVIPCYNEEEMLDETIRVMNIKIKELIKTKKISSASKIVFVDDGSSDNTWIMIEGFCKKNKYVEGIKLSKNRGHQNALLSGLLTCKDDCDAIISLDADLQDDINVLDEFIDRYYEGNEIVYGVRNSRKKDSFFKRNTALAFYKLMKMMGVDVVYNHADYRLMSKVVLDHLELYKEVNLFLRGIIPLIGFKSTNVYYERKERFAGETKYSLKKMLSLAFEAITSFSIKPIRLIFFLGLFIVFISVIMILYSIIAKVTGNAVSGWTFIICSIWFLGGVQMISLGIIGEYIGKMYSETKKRPRFIIEKRLK